MICDDCRDAIQDTSCGHRAEPLCWDCSLRDCAECASDARDDHAAEMAEGGWGEW